MQLTPHFSIEEFERSDLAQERRINNTMPAMLLANARGACEMLERCRAYLSKLVGHDVPIDLLSGFRCWSLNDLVGGQRNSDHLRAQAADWRAPLFGAPLQICQALEDAIEHLGIGQLIYEVREGSAWVHASIVPRMSADDRVITIAPGGKVMMGIVSPVMNEMSKP